MKALHMVIVKAGATYNNKVGVKGLDFTVNVDIDDVLSINRTVEVVSAPEGSGLDPGDTIVVHHNILRENIHSSGKKTRGVFYIADNHWWVPMSEVIMKKSSKGVWEPLHDFLFVEPIDEEIEEIGNGLFLIPRNRKGKKMNTGIVRINNSKMDDISIGDKVYLANYSEHEFIIDGKTLYKCEIEDILLKM